MKTYIFAVQNSSSYFFWILEFTMLGVWRSLVSVIDWGSRGREFKSPHSDNTKAFNDLKAFLIYDSVFRLYNLQYDLSYLKYDVRFIYDLRDIAEVKGFLEYRCKLLAFIKNFVHSIMVFYYPTFHIPHPTSNITL